MTIDDVAGSVLKIVGDVGEVTSMGSRRLMLAQYIHARQTLWGNKKFYDSKLDLTPILVFFLNIETILFLREVMDKIQSILLL